jgi:Protein of unknown function (DUF2809)
MTARPPTHSFVLVLVTIAAGLAVRLVPLGLPPVIVKYAGSTLWALMIYWIGSTLLATTRIPITALISGLLATSVEFLKLYRTPSLDAFRLTLPGILLLGRYFSGWDILAYWVAIALGALADRALLRSRNQGVGAVPAGSAQ